MGKRLGVIMDPIATITPYKDTTLAMLLEAQRRGWELHYMELGGLEIIAGRAFGRTRGLEVADDNTRWFELGATHHLPLDELDVVLMRKDPPFDSEYLYATHILTLAQQAGCLVLNDPRGLRDANEKLFALHFPQCCPPTIVSRDPGHIKAFVQEHGKAVIKPLHGMGGTGIFVVGHGEPNINVIIETVTELGKRYAMVQRYLPEIKAGDKRILVIDGEAVPYALARIPAQGETRGNLAAGGRGEGVELSERDRWIVAQVAPTLVERGLLFVGLDVIGDYLTEINVTSPTCVRELDAIYDINISARFFDAIERRLA
ncbi:MAG TPA: glutathione synthase [Gammaproteobacteria bacterium]|nr:glutathione synthase [Gammaproteobacteria bacterium]